MQGEGGLVGAGRVIMVYVGTGSVGKHCEDSSVGRQGIGCRV